MRGLLLFASTGDEAWVCNPINAKMKPIKTLDMNLRLEKLKKHALHNKRELKNEHILKEKQFMKLPLLKTKIQENESTLACALNMHECLLA